MLDTLVAVAGMLGTPVVITPAAVAGSDAPIPILASVSSLF